MLRRRIAYISKRFRVVDIEDVTKLEVAKFMNQYWGHCHTNFNERFTSESKAHKYTKYLVIREQLPYPVGISLV